MTLNNRTTAQVLFSILVATSLTACGGGSSGMKGASGKAVSPGAAGDGAHSGTAGVGSGAAAGVSSGDAIAAAGAAVKEPAAGPAGSPANQGAAADAGATAAARDAGVAAGPPVGPVEVAPEVASHAPIDDMTACTDRVAVKGDETPDPQELIFTVDRSPLDGQAPRIEHPELYTFVRVFVEGDGPSRSGREGYWGEATSSGDVAPMPAERTIDLSRKQFPSLRCVEVWGFRGGFNVVVKTDLPAWGWVRANGGEGRVKILSRNAVAADVIGGGDGSSTELEILAKASGLGRLVFLSSGTLLSTIRVLSGREPVRIVNGNATAGGSSIRPRIFLENFGKLSPYTPAEIDLRLTDHSPD